MFDKMPDNVTIQIYPLVEIIDLSLIMEYYKQFQ